jgi:hypothetical protein
MAWINNSVDPEISQSVFWMDNASEIWKELKTVFITVICYGFQIFKKRFAPSNKVIRPFHLTTQN